MRKKKNNFEAIEKSPKYPILIKNLNSCDRYRGVLIWNIMSCFNINFSHPSKSFYCINLSRRSTFSEDSTDNVTIYLVPKVSDYFAIL